MKYVFIKILIAVSIIIGAATLTCCIKEIDSADVFVVPEPVVNALFSEGSMLEIQISLSRSIIRASDAEREFIYPDNAIVRLFENTVELNCNSTFDRNLYILSLLELKPENSYMIEIELPEFTLLTAESTIPSLTKIDSIMVRRVFETDPELNEIDQDILKGSVIFRDSQEQEYYMLQLEAYDYIYGNEIYDRKNDYFTSDDPVATDAGYQPEDIRVLVFSDKLFKDNVCDISFEIIDGLYSAGVKDSTVLVTKLYTLSEELYRYLITFHGQYIADFSFMAEPVQVYSNIENGLGIFAGYSLDSLAISIK